MGGWMPYVNKYYWMDIMPLSEKVFWMVRFRFYMNAFFEANATPRVPNLIHIAEYCLRKPDFKTRFWTASAVHHFMREMHRQNYLKQIILNYHVDTSQHTNYKWEFFRPCNSFVRRASILEGGQKNTIDNVTGRYVASDGTKLLSTHELYIYEELIRVKEIAVEYEKYYEHRSEYKKPDFTITMYDIPDPYVWEHFGMSEDAGYFYKMANKIEWYFKAGLTPIDQGGKLIFTIFENEHVFQHRVSEIIDMLRKRGCCSLAGNYK